MQTEQSLYTLIEKCEFNDWNIKLRWDKDRPYLQVQFMAPCNMGHREPYEQRCRKWFLSLHMTDSEVINTAFLAIERAVLHETKEQFKFDGQPIFRPHYSVYELHSLSSRNAVEKRKDFEKVT